MLNPEKTKIYIVVGSAHISAEYGFHEELWRVNIFEINPDGSGEQIYILGL